MTTGSLFLSQAKSRFMDITRSRYTHMAERLAAKRLPLPFTREQLRSFVLDKLGDRYDGAVRCRYCGRVCSLEETELDHAVALERGGWTGLDNLDLPCANCNAQKGEMPPEAFTELLLILETNPQLAPERPDILLRLQMHSKLIADKRRNEATIRMLKASGEWPKAKKKIKPPLQEVIDESF